MVSRVLIKLIDQSIIPAILLLSVRVLSIILVSSFFGIDYSLGYSGFEFAKPTEYILVNSYSTFFMVMILAVGLFYILLKSFIFHDSHIAPGLTAKVFSLKLSSFIQSSFNLYSQGIVWLSYLYLMMFATGIMALFNLVFPWVFYVSLVLSVLSTALFVYDIEAELKFASEADGDPDSEDFVLNFGDDYAR